MRRMSILLSLGILTISAWFVLIPVAYAECTCIEEVDYAMEATCYQVGGSWDAYTCTGGCNPQAVAQCAQQGGTMDSSCVCQGAYNPCDYITQYQEVYFYSWCYAQCTGYMTAYVCCWADAIYITYGATGQFCGYYSVTNSFLGCMYSSYVSECGCY